VLFAQVNSVNVLPIWVVAHGVLWLIGVVVVALAAVFGSKRRR